MSTQTTKYALYCTGYMGMKRWLTGMPEAGELPGSYDPSRAKLFTAAEVEKARAACPYPLHELEA